MKKTGIIVGLIVLLGLGGIAGGYYYFVQRPNITVGDDGIIFIQPGDSFETVMTTLISSGRTRQGCKKRIHPSQACRTEKISFCSKNRPVSPGRQDEQ